MSPNVVPTTNLIPLPVTAVSKLKPSVLATPQQMELMGGDVDLVDFHLQMRNKAGIELVDSIVDATVDRVIDGASTLVVTVDDTLNRQIQLSGKLGRKVDVNVNGLWWTLVAIKKQSRQLQLTFEEREVNLLRYYDSFMYAQRGPQMTRAEFVLKMIQEVKEERLKWVIPELKEVTKPSDQLQPGQVLMDFAGNPITSSVDQAQQAMQREQGIHMGTKLTVKGQPATPEQINNANLILAQGKSMGANTKVLISAITTAITESTLHNYTGGDLDSVGLFQQRASWGSYEARHDPSTSAALYFRSAIPADQTAPNAYIKDLCQSVQHSAFSDGSNYAPWVDEGAQFVAAYGSEIPQSVKDQLTKAQTGAAQTQQALSGTSAAVGVNQFFSRGTLAQKNTFWILTKENSWDCMNRLAKEVNWRAFCVSGTIYFVSEKYLFASKPFMTISEDTVGIDWIDYDYDEGKRHATVTVTCHMSRWAAPPGSIVQIQDMGIINGRWLVEEVTRSLYDNIGTITLNKPLPVLPEPITLPGIPKNAPIAITPPGQGKAGASTAGSGYVEVPWGQLTAIQKKVITYAQNACGLPYQYGAEDPGVAFDCSGLTQAAYASAGISIPRTSETQWTAGPVEMSALQPADLVFFVGSDGTFSSPGHVGIYIGNGHMINAPYTGVNVRVDGFDTSNRNPNDPNGYVGATSPWRK